MDLIYIPLLPLEKSSFEDPLSFLDVVWARLLLDVFAEGECN